MVQETEEDKSFLQSSADFFKNLDYGQLAEESIPLVGENIIIGDIKENLKEGSLGSAALNTGALAIGTVPIVGDLAARPFRALAKKYSKAQNALKEAIKKSETSSNSYYTRPKEKLKKAATHFFKTAQGSEYVRVGGGATVRDKKPRNAVMHRGQGGPQPPSEVTVYLDDEAAIHAESLITDTKGSDGFSIFKLVPTRAVDEKTGIGRAKVVYSENFGKGKFLKKKGETKKNNVGKNRELQDAEFSFTTTPKVGLTPFEIFDQHSAHIGNKIIEVAPVSAADILKYNKKELKMAEGGPVMALEEQTEMAFGDEPPRRDPVSGNEVPPGALPSEVRDDIPAQLSEGEYVVPADVLQYYGIKFFEDLRSKAKTDLADLDSRGRIGGESMEEDDFPFAAEELETIDDNSEERPQAFNEGGVTEMETPYFMGGNQSVVKTYVNDDGLKMYIRFINGIAVPPIPTGYYEEGTTDTTAPVSPVNVADSNNNDDSNEDNKNFIGYDNLNADQIAQFTGQVYGSIGNFLGILPGVGLALNKQKENFIAAAERISKDATISQTIRDAYANALSISKLPSNQQKDAAKKFAATTGTRKVQPWLGPWSYKAQLDAERKSKGMNSLQGLMKDENIEPTIKAAMDSDTGDEGLPFGDDDPYVMKDDPNYKLLMERNAEAEKKAAKQRKEEEDNRQSDREMGGPQTQEEMDFDETGGAYKKGGLATRKKKKK